MAAETEPRTGLVVGFDFDDQPWDDQLEPTLRKFAAVGYHLSVADRDLNTPPGSPSTGDTYIVAAGASGAWTGLEDDVVIWDGTAWVNYTPAIGWIAYLEDEQKLSAYKVGGWSAGVAI